MADIFTVAKKMYKPGGANKKAGMHRPEGAGNFDNMDDYNIVNSMDINEGTIQDTPSDDKDIANKKYVDDNTHWERTGTVLSPKNPDDIDIGLKSIKVGSSNARIGSFGDFDTRLAFDAGDTGVIQWKNTNEWYFPDGDAKIEFFQGRDATYSIKNSFSTWKASLNVQDDLTVNGTTFFVDSDIGSVGVGINTPKINFHLLTSGTSGLGGVPAGRGMAFSGNHGFNRFYMETLNADSGKRVGFMEYNNGFRFSSLIDNAGAFVTENMVFFQADGNVGIDTTNPTTKFSVEEKGGMTPIGGFAIKLTNKTGANTVQGQLVRASFPAGSDTDNAFEVIVINSAEVIGIVLEAGVSDGSEAWVVISGMADVLMDAGGSIRGDRIISSGNTAGSADVWNVGGAVATHFQEIGHCIETRAGAGLARCVLHFN